MPPLPELPPAYPDVLSLGGLEVRPPLVLAPMAGLTDAAFRRTVRRCGGVGLVVSEILPSEGLLRGPRRMEGALRIAPDEHPIALQVSGSRPERVAEAARMCEARGADVVDINMGCPVAKVTKGLCGAALLRDARQAALIVSAVVDAVSVPVTAKLRLGWSSTEETFLEVARAVTEAGASALTLHPRTREQGYSGQARWEAIARLKEAVAVPVVGNGDVKVPRDALDLFKAPPPPITADNVAIDKADDPRQGEATANKQCEGLGKADFDLKVTTQDLQPAFGGFLTEAISLLAPQLQVLMFAQNFLMDKDSVPAMVTVKLDLKGASKDCDIVGLVYKCGTGVQPLLNGKFDFSNPTGYIDLSQRFNAGAGYSAPAPSSCMSFNNPDGSLMQNPLPYTRPQIDGDIVSFSVQKCAEPILQFAKVPGLDIISSALSGFSYYFAFAYVDSSGNYGPATIEGAEIPPIIDKLMEQLGFANTGLLGLLQGLDSNMVLDAFGLEGFADELSAVRKSIGSLSLDTMITNLRGEALNTAMGELSSVIKDEDAKELFDKIVQDGRINDADAAILLQPIRDELKDEDALSIINQLEAPDLSYADKLIQAQPLEQKKELLAEVYDYPEDIPDMGEQEVDEELSMAMQDKEEAVKILQSLSPEQRLAAVQGIMDQAPSKVIEAANDIIPDDYKITSIKSIPASISGELSGAQGELSRLIAYYSPDYVKKEVMGAITSSVPGFGQYNDVLKLFSDLPGQSCSID